MLSSTSNSRPPYAEEDFEAIATRLATLSNEETLLITSAFSNVLNLHNVSEHVASAMEERHARLDDIPRGPAKTTNGAIKGLVAKGVDVAEIYKHICGQEVDLVLTVGPGNASTSFPDRHPPRFLSLMTS